MKKIKSKLFLIIMCSIIFTGIGVFAIEELYANDIRYRSTNVKQALDGLYNLVNTQDNRLYLYWQGNTFDDVTGGWDSSIDISIWGGGSGNGISKKNAVFNDDHIDLSTDNTYQYVVANTVNKIDCTEYNYATVWYSLTRTYNTAMCIESTLTPVYYNEAPSRIFRTSEMNLSNSYAVTYPITCSEPGYISFNTIRGIARDTTTDLKIYGVYLSKTLN